MKHLLLLLTLFSSATVSAQMPENQALRGIYRTLSEDFLDEALTMDAVTEPRQDREAMIHAFRSALSSGDANRFVFEKGKTWSNLWPIKTEPATALEATSFATIQAAGQVLDPIHSIHDIDGYISARLGQHSARLIRDELVIPVVIGGAEGSLQQKFPGSSFFKIPSFYESWGITKYLVSVPGQTIPRLVYVVPPSIQYLQHYQAMLTRLTGKTQDIVLNVSDRKKWKRALSTASADLLRRLGGSTDYVTFGYFKQWSQVGSQHGTLKIMSISETITSGEGVFGRKITVQDTVTGHTFETVAIGNMKTIWGEASAFMLEGAFDLTRRGVLFMGSAGGLSDKLSVYDLSIPSAFKAPDTVPIANFVLRAKQSAVGPVVFGTVHGNTSSPAVQTLSYISTQLQRGSETIDVEQSLVAKAVTNYNVQANRDLQFGAINIITDTPFGAERNDLDRINEMKKQNSRLNAVRLALDAMQSNGTVPQCRLVFR